MQPALVAGHPIAPVLSGVKGNNTKSTPEGVDIINPRQVMMMAIMPSSSPGFTGVKDKSTSPPWKGGRQ
ncbi:MAG: hypothetical protein ACOXZO_10870 [Bacteroidales bacterium]